MSGQAYTDKGNFTSEVIQAALKGNQEAINIIVNNPKNGNIYRPTVTKLIGNREDAPNLYRQLINMNPSLFGYLKQLIKEDKNNQSMLNTTVATSMMGVQGQKLNSLGQTQKIIQYYANQDKKQPTVNDLSKEYVREKKTILEQAMKNKSPNFQNEAVKIWWIDAPFPQDIVKTYGNVPQTLLDIAINQVKLFKAGKGSVKSYDIPTQWLKTDSTGYPNIAILQIAHNYNQFLLQKGHLAIKKSVDQQKKQQRGVVVQIVPNVFSFCRFSSKTASKIKDTYVKRVNQWIHVIEPEKVISQLVKQYGDLRARKDVMTIQQTCTKNSGVIVGESMMRNQVFIPSGIRDNYGNIQNWGKGSIGKSTFNKQWFSPWDGEVGRSMVDAGVCLSKFSRAVKKAKKLLNMTTAQQEQYNLKKVEQAKTRQVRSRAAEGKRMVKYQALGGKIDQNTAKALYELGTDQIQTSNSYKGLIQGVGNVWKARKQQAALKWGARGTPIIF